MEEQLLQVSTQSWPTGLLLSVNATTLLKTRLTPIKAGSGTDRG